MLNRELFLQLFLITLTAGLVSLLVIRLYPTRLIKQTAVASKTTQTIPTTTPLPQSQKDISNLQPTQPPIAIEIPKLQLKLPIAPGMIVNDEWTLYDDKVSWLTTSQVPGRGNVILYAHNRIGLFAGLKNLKIGDEILVTHDKQLKKYIVKEKRAVTPRDVDAVLSDHEQLTLYTCDGYFDQKRLVLIAEPKA